MNNSAARHPSHKSLKLLSCLVLPRSKGSSASDAARTDLTQELMNLSRAEFDDLVELAGSNHVIVRGLEAFLSLVSENDDPVRVEWARSALQNELARIESAVGFLHEVCTALEQNGCRLAVIKSLDHLPDLGSDLDLFTTARAEDVITAMQSNFSAKLAPRSWGDRLAHKWNFIVPGLPELIEVHVGRLGQTGEQAAIANTLLDRARWIQIGERSFRTTSISDRLMISTLQRMYRHFYFRLCDIGDTAELVDAGAIDYQHLRASASIAGIWQGVATYLAIVSDYVQCYRGVELDLPNFVRDSARFGGEHVYYSKSFLRVPIMPQSVRLYSSQLAVIIGRGEFHNGARLSLLPWLATAAVVGQKLTGSDKGIW
jgi:hypothetical protein